MTSPRTREFPLERLFTRQDLRPAAVEPVDDAQLGRLERVALTLDGTLTIFLEMLTDQAIRSEALPDTGDDGADLLPNLGLAGHDGGDPQAPGPAGERVKFRAVLLRGETTGDVYVGARSLLVPDRAPAGFLEAIATSRAGIGQALVRTRAETLRELLWYGRIPREKLPPALPSQVEAPLCRSYVIIHRGKPFACIEEIFLTKLEQLSRA